jgi:hypothetical protein
MRSNKMNNKEKIKKLKKQILYYEEKIKKIRSEIDELDDEYMTFDGYRYDNDTDWKRSCEKYKKSEVSWSQSCNGWDFYLYCNSRNEFIHLRKSNGNILLTRV